MRQGKAWYNENDPEKAAWSSQPERESTTGRLADSDGRQSRDGGLQPGGQHGFFAQNSGDDFQHPFAGALNGFWGNADWLLCTDGRWRPVEPGTFPLDSGAAARLGRLRGYGDAINAQVAKAFIEAVMEATR